MPDFQRTVEFLRDLRQGPLQNVTEEITQAATEYAALCVQANERLRKCSSFLQQGLRTEALHLADESPNLLDLVAALDLPDAQAWADFCQNNSLPVPPPLQLDRAAQLNDAYAQDQPLEHLLSQHRLLALSRGPIAERLSILRKISSIDAASTHWEKDIRVFEKARIKELPAAFYNAVKHRDDAAISSLMTEVTQQPWFEPVPADLAAAVTDAFARMNRAAVEIELRKMVEPLREAYAARSFHECQALVKQWKNAMAAVNVTTIAPDLTDEIRPVVAYVAEQEKRVEYMRKFRDSCKAFAKLLDMDLPDAQLETGYARLKEFNEPIPEELTARYNAKGSARQRVIDQKHRARLIGMGASAAAAAIVILIVVVLVMRASDAKKWADKIEHTIASKSFANLQSAQQDIAELRKTHPSFLGEASLAAAVRDTQAMQAEYDRDSAAIQGLMLKFDDAAKAANTVAQNKDTPLDQLLAVANSLDDTLKQSTAAGDLAWADSPDKKYAAAVTQLQGILASVRSRAATAVRAQVLADSAKVDAIGPTPPNMSEAGEQLSEIAAQLRNLTALMGLDDDTKAAVAALSQKVDERRQSLASASTIAGELDNIRQNSASPDDLKKALAGYIQRFPTDARVPEFTAAIDRLPLAKDAEAWHDMSTAWAGQFAPPNAAAAQKRIDAITAYLAAHPNSPMTPIANTYLDYLRRAVDALAEKGTWQLAFADLFSNPMLTDLAYLETSDGQRFYVMGDIKRTDRRINDRVSVTFEALNPSDVTKRMLVAVDLPITLTTKDPIPAAHAKLVSDLNDQLKTIDAANWDTWGIDTITTLLKKKQISIAIRAILLQQTMKTENAVADWAIGDAYTQALTELSRQKPENLSWLDTSRISAGTVRSLQQTFDSIPAASTIKDKLASAKATLFKTASFDVIATAVLLKDDAGNWSVGTKTPATDGQLWTALPSSSPTPPPPATPPSTDPAAPTPAAAPNPGSLIQIGTVSAGKYALYENTLHNLPQGTLIFITQP